MDYLHELFSLDGKTALITGASKGLGRAAAKALSGAGANVVLVGRDMKGLEETEREISGKALIFEADVTLADDRTKVISDSIEHFGKIDVLVNNAGIIRRSPVLEHSREDWNDVIETNLNAVFDWSQACAKEMMKTGGGKIINIASMLSFTGGFNVVSYAAAKGGVAQLTKAMGNELAKHNINVNAVAPGYFETNTTAAIRKNPDRMQNILSRIPFGRFGKPDELAGTFIFLASHASDYMSGHILCVDGGFNSY